jgi:hypothetical protein
MPPTACNVGNDLATCHLDRTQHPKNRQLDCQDQREIPEQLWPHPPAERHVEGEVADVHHVRGQKNQHRRACQQNKGSRPEARARLQCGAVDHLLHAARFWGDAE